MGINRVRIDIDSPGNPGYYNSSYLDTVNACEQGSPVLRHPLFIYDNLRIIVDSITEEDYHYWGFWLYITKPGYEQEYFIPATVSYPYTLPLDSPIPPSGSVAEDIGYVIPVFDSCSELLPRSGDNLAIDSAGNLAVDSNGHLTTIPPSE